jgi:tetratricopeptide (TPR) repeat protein
MRRASLFRKLDLKDRAKADAENAIKLDPNNANFYRIRGSWAREDRDYEGAIRDFDSAIGLDPGASIHHFFKGLVLKEMKDYRLAIDQIERAIELEPNNAEYYCTRGRIYTYISDFESALQDLNRAVDYDPQNSDYWHWRGRIRRERQECSEAMRDFETALRITNDDIDYAWRGIMQSHMKNNLAALEDINKAISLAPSNSFHYQFKGIIFFGMDNVSGARENFAKAIELLPDWAGHYVWHSAASEAQDLASAMNDLDKAVELRPDEVSLFWRGLGYLGLGEIKKAQYDLEAAYKQSSPVSARIPFWRAVIASLNKEESEAQRLFDEAIRLASSDRKAGHFAEPARCFLFRDKNRKKARELYKEMFDGNFTIDNSKTEQSHLELLVQLFPENSYIKKTLTWFHKTRKNVYLPSVTKPLPQSSSKSAIELVGEKSSSANNLR